MPTPTKPTIPYVVWTSPTGLYRVVCQPGLVSDNFIVEESYKNAMLDTMWHPVTNIAAALIALAAGIAALKTP